MGTQIIFCILLAGMALLCSGQVNVTETDYPVGAGDDKGTTTTMATKDSIKSATQFSNATKVTESSSAPERASTDAEVPAGTSLTNDTSKQTGNTEVGETGPSSSPIYDSTTTTTTTTNTNSAHHHVADAPPPPGKSFWSTGSFFIGIVVTGFLVGVVVIARKKRSSLHSFIPT